MSDEIKYEDAVKELDEIVSKLENGTVSLDESIKLFEKGSDKLKKAEQKITMLTKENNND